MKGPLIGPRGIIFQTLLEARWADFFEKLQLDWRYNKLFIVDYIPSFIITIPGTTDRVIIDVISTSKYDELKKYSDRLEQFDLDQLGVKYPYIIVGNGLFYKKDINEALCSVNHNDDIPVIGLLKVRHNNIGDGGDGGFPDAIARAPVFLSMVNNVVVFNYWCTDDNVLYDLKNFAFRHGADGWSRDQADNKYIENLWIKTENKPPRKPQLKTQYIQNESYMHKKAKEVLIEWFSSGDGEYCTFENLSFRKNYVIAEYPLAINDRFDSSIHLWHECYDGAEDAPSFDWCVDNGIYPYAVLDVMVSEKGHPRYGFEVVYKHACEPEKINKLERHCGGLIEVYEISAEWILKQTKKPSKLEFIRRII
jgi:hypothetical protein